jgi:hypothetical protein
MDNLIEKCLLTDLELAEVNYCYYSDAQWDERKRLLRAQLQKAFPIIQQALLDVDEEGILSDESICYIQLENIEDKTYRSKSGSAVSMLNVDSLLKAQKLITRERTMKEIVDWIDKHNACSIDYGLNIGSNVWQPYRQTLTVN